jgi:proteic killer suppression protein
VDILFRTTEMAKDMNDGKARVRKYGPERAKRIALRLDQMHASANLAVFRAVHARCHRLSGDRSGQWSADLDGPYRLIFEVADEPEPQDAYGRLDTAAVRRVRIIDVTDTH